MPSRFLLSPQAASAVAGLLAEHGGVRTEPRRIASPPGSEAPQLFDLRISAGRVLCYLPPDMDPGYLSGVNVNGIGAHPHSLQPIGTSADPWADIGAAPTSPDDMGVVLGFVADENATAHFSWRLDILSTGYMEPSWASLKAPLGLVGLLLKSRDYVPLQLHRGSFDVGLGWLPGRDEVDCYGKAIGNSSQTRVIDLDARKLQGGSWEFVNGLVFGNHSLSLQSVTINGTNYQLLGYR